MILSSRQTYSINEVLAVSCAERAVMSALGSSGDDDAVDEGANTEAAASSRGCCDHDDEQCEWNGTMAPWHQTKSTLSHVCAGST